MSDTLSRKICKGIYMGDSKSRKADNYRGSRYKIYIPTYGIAKFCQVTVETHFKNHSQRIIIYNSELRNSSLDAKKYCQDYDRMGELIFLLAVKFKCDIERGIDEDNAGFLNTSEIKELNSKRCTNVPQTIYTSRNRAFKDRVEFLKKFLVVPEQIYHLTCFVGKTGRKNVQDLSWWLNVSADDIYFYEGKNKIPSQNLTEQFDKLFPQQFLWKEPEIKKFYDKYVEKTKSSDNEHEITDQKIQFEECPDFELKQFREKLKAPKTSNETEQKAENLLISAPFIRLEKRLEPFYKRYPTQKDFKEGGSYCRINELHEEITNKLQEKKRCLIIGNPGCGKTTLALGLGYDFLLTDHSVHYFDASRSVSIKRLADFINSCDKKTLLIFDNAHADFENINQLLCSNHKHDCLLLVTSHNVNPSITQSPHPDDLKKSISYIEIFKEENLLKEINANKKTVKHIINQYTGNLIPEEKIGNIDILVEKCNADYNILQFYIQAWKSKEQKGYLSEVCEKEILEDVFTRYLKGKPYQLELLKIAALSQFEIDTDYKWIKRDLDELQKDGLVQLTGTDEIEQGRYVSWLRIYHPSTAKYLLKTAAFKNLNNFDRVDKFTFLSLKDYLGTLPCNFFRTLTKGYAYLNNNYRDKLLGCSEFQKSVKEIIQTETLDFIIANKFELMQCLSSFCVPGKFQRSSFTKDEFAFAVNLFNIFKNRLDTEGIELIDLTTFSLLCDISSGLGIKGVDELIDIKNLIQRANSGMFSAPEILEIIGNFLDKGYPDDHIYYFCNELNLCSLGKGLKEDNRDAPLFRELTIGYYDLEEEVYNISELNLQLNNAGWDGFIPQLAAIFIRFALRIGISKEKVDTFWKGLGIIRNPKQAKLPFT